MRGCTPQERVIRRGWSPRCLPGRSECLALGVCAYVLPSHGAPRRLLAPVHTASVAVAEHAQAEAWMETGGGIAVAHAAPSAAHASPSHRQRTRHHVQEPAVASSRSARMLDWAHAIAQVRTNNGARVAVLPGILTLIVWPHARAVIQVTLAHVTWSSPGQAFGRCVYCYETRGGCLMW